MEKKNRNPFSFQSTARLLFSCNNIPRNYGDRSEGFYRRLIIIRFDHAVPEEKRMLTCWTSSALRPTASFSLPWKG